MNAVGDSVTLALGVVLGLIWYRRTGWSCGGVITPGLLALYSTSPLRTLLPLVLGVLLTVPLSMLSRRFTLYGRERVGTAMLLALAVRVLLAYWLLDFHWFGWVVPGLIAADAERQGTLITVSSALACGAAASFCLTLLRVLGATL